MFTTTTVLFLVYVFLGLDALLLIILLAGRWQRRRKDHIRALQTDFILSAFPDQAEHTAIRLIDRHRKLFIECFIQLHQSLVVDEALKSKLTNYLSWRGRDRYYLRRLRSPFRLKRIEAATILGYLWGDTIQSALEDALRRERSYSVRIYLANALADIGRAGAIPTLVESLPRAPLWYQQKIQVLLSQFGFDFHEYLPNILDSNLTEMQALIIHFASEYVADDLRDYLLQKAVVKNRTLARAAADGLARLYPQALDSELFLDHRDPVIQGIAIRALQHIRSRNTLDRLLDMTGDARRVHAVAAASNILQHKPRYLPYVSQRFRTESDKDRRLALAEIMANRIEYFLANILSRDSDLIKDLLAQVLLMHQASSVIGFLNRNRDREVENEILSVIREVIRRDRYLAEQFRTYLDDRLLEKLRRTRLKPAPGKRDEKRERVKLVWLYSLLVGIILIFPGIYVLRRWDLLTEFSPFQHLAQYVIDFNYLLGFYFGSVNSIYILILVFSLLGVARQSRFWQVKKLTTLFKSRMLPSISIIAPAYCEEAGIIESTNSLLNLKYPDYDLIVVNDGSSDQTLNRLIEYYHLERIDFEFKQQIPTMPVRGIYLNRSIPKLLVVDKANGGKADSLNVGINISRKEYFCGIDADSLLETDALLKVISPVMDDDEESVASGGNILPINGCAVDRGLLTSIALPKNRVARFQTIEYLRAFMAGRVGWSYINSLLIISGAFGLFRKERVIETGGYLTSKGKYHKDTVGEDMELVVRLTRYMRRKRLQHRIHYAFNANCWTEVPESLNILGRQRDRWHRGLIDILIFHRRLLFNPFYGRVGVIALPYFFIFEFVGPLIEVQGYVMVIMAAVLGLLNPPLALFLFLTGILMGTVVSLFSLIMAGEILSKFKVREILLMLYYAVLENFGFRQLSSWWRVTGFFSSLKKPKGWGKMVRKGFATQSSSS